MYVILDIYSKYSILKRHSSVVLKIICEFFSYFHLCLHFGYVLLNFQNYESQHFHLSCIRLFLAKLYKMQHALMSQQNSCSTSIVVFRTCHLFSNTPNAHSTVRLILNNLQLDILLVLFNPRLENGCNKFERSPNASSATKTNG